MGRPLKFKSPEDLEKQIQEYYVWCKENDKHITVSGLAWWLEVDRITLIRYEKCDEWNWLQTLSKEERERYSNTIKRAKQRIQSEYEQLLFNKGSNTGAIFTLKNNYSWVDKQEVVTTDKKAIEDISDAALDKELSRLE